MYAVATVTKPRTISTPDRVFGQGMQLSLTFDASKLNSFETYNSTVLLLQLRTEHSPEVRKTERSAAQGWAADYE